LQSFGNVTHLPLPSFDKDREFPISFGNPQWDFTVNVMLGIKKSVSEMEAFPSYNILPKDYKDIREFILPSDDIKKESWTFKEFAPKVYKKIRDIMLIDQADFMYSFGAEQILGHLTFGSLSTLANLSSSGRSGSIFLKTTNTKYLIKKLFLKMKMYY